MPNTVKNKGDYYFDNQHMGSNWNELQADAPTEICQGYDEWLKAVAAKQSLIITALNIL